MGARGRETRALCCVVAPAGPRCRLGRRAASSAAPVSRRPSSIPTRPRPRRSPSPSGLHPPFPAMQRRSSTAHRTVRRSCRTQPRPNWGSLGCPERSGKPNLSSQRMHRDPGDPRPRAAWSHPPPQGPCRGSPSTPPNLTRPLRRPPHAGRTRPGRGMRRREGVNPWRVTTRPSPRSSAASPSEATVRARGSPSRPRALCLTDGLSRGCRNPKMALGRSAMLPRSTHPRQAVRSAACRARPRRPGGAPSGRRPCPRPGPLPRRALRVRCPPALSPFGPPVRCSGRPR